MKLTDLIHTKHGNKISKLLLISALSSSSLLVYAQQQQVQLSGNNLPLKTIFEQIEKQTHLSIDYKVQDIDDSQVIENLPGKGSVESILQQLLDGSGCTVTFSDGHILISKTGTNSKPSSTQTRTISGTVVDETNLPVIGANVMVKGTTNGTITDMEGRFTLEVPEGANLEISYIGYNTQTISVQGQTKINIPLKENTQALEEVVVVGYGTFKKSDLTGAITQVKGEEIANLPLRSAADALQGKAAGVTITANSGSPGSLGDVRIRGIGTLNGNNPLYVVDGMPQSDIGWLNPRDIENMEVLKDASAQAIYGARAANGVILITTKRGGKGNTYHSNIEFDMSVGFQSVPKSYDMLDAEGFMEYKNRAYAAAGMPLPDDFSTEAKRNEILSFLEKNGSREGTDWWDEITRSPSEAINQNYNLAFSGGMDKLRYRSSFSYMNHQGVLKGSEYERLSGRLNLDTEIKKWLSLSANLSVIYEGRKNIQENDSYTATVFSTAAADPITPVYRDNLIDVPDFLYDRIYNKYEPKNEWSRYTGVLYSNKPNTVAQVDRSALNKWKGYATKGNIIGDIKLFPFLTFKSSFSLDLKRNQSDGFIPSYYLDGDEYNTYPTVSRTIDNTDYWVFDNYLTYNQQLGRHQITAMVGSSAEKQRYEYIYTSKQGMANNDERLQILDAGTINPQSNGYVSITSLNSYFGRAFYSFDNRYMITVNMRWDGSSQFAPGNRWGFFPSVSGGWNFSEERFMDSLNWLSQGKLRIGWGEIGNQTIPLGAYLNTFGDGPYYILGNKNTILSGGRTQVGNVDLKWETTKQFDIGFDLAFFDGSFRTSFDYFDRKTEDMLVQVPSPSTLGFPNNPWVNAGSISNRGVEISLMYDGKVGSDFTYHINGNISTYKNKVLDLGSDSNIPGKGIHLGYYSYTMTEVGKPIGYYYGYKTDGVFQTQEEIDNYVNNGSIVMPNAKPGDLKFVDLNKDGKLGEEDRTMVGNPHPDFTFGLTLGAEYKGFDFTAFFQGSVGNDILNILKYDLYGGVGWYNAPKDILTTFWNGPGSTNENFAIDANSRLNREMSSWFVEDGSYIRLKNLQIGYTLPKSWTEKIHFNNLRVYVAAQNLFTITGYSGLDPEIGELNGNPLYKGVDMGFYPQSRTFMFGVSMKL